MADQYRPELPEHRSRSAENTVKDKLRLAEYANTTNAIDETDDLTVEHFGDTERNTRKELSLCSKRLTNLPANFGVYMKNLTQLDLSENKLTNLPDALKFIAKLETLLLDRNCIKNVPLVITELSCLRVLQLSDNYIETLPAEVGDMTCLEALILASNRLQELPESLKKLNRLKTLNVSNNCLQKMPSCLGDNVSLETVILSSNKLGNLPPSFGQLNQLKTLDLSSNYLKKLPVCISKGMQNLRSLNVSYNKFINVTPAPASEKLEKLYIREVGARSKFPLWLFGGCAPRLELLDLEGTKFHCFNMPDNCPSLSIKTLSLQRCSFYDSFINELTRHTDRLECLKIGNGWCGETGNAFWTMPIMNLKNPELLTKIDLRATGLPVVCQAIRRLVNLVTLDIGQNNISLLCNEICTLEKLEVLLIDGNDIAELPDDIGRMASLKELKANDNSLARLPMSIMDLKDLAYLDLYNNEFSERPTDVEYLDNLLGLDLDRNNFTINDTDFINDTPYKIVKEAVRNRYLNRDHYRFTGPRYKMDTDKEADTSSDTSSATRHERETNDFDINANCTGQSEEDWDNSADEFEPGRNANQSSFGKWAYVERAMAMGISPNRFCPADLHTPPVRNRVAQILAEGKISGEFAVQEGQFEDA